MVGLVAQAPIERPLKQLGGTLAFALRNAEDVRPAAAIEFNQRAAEMVQLLAQDFGILGKPGVEILVRLMNVAVQLVVEEVFDVPEAEDVFAGRRRFGGGITRPYATGQEQDEN